jgi:hypothetical protein
MGSAGPGGPRTLIVPGVASKQNAKVWEPLGPSNCCLSSQAVCSLEFPFPSGDLEVPVCSSLEWRVVLHVLIKPFLQKIN